jgi:hypothetical protein
VRIAGARRIMNGIAPDIGNLIHESRIRTVKCVVEDFKGRCGRGEEKPNGGPTAQIHTEIVNAASVSLAKGFPIVIHPMIPSVRPLLCLVEIGMSWGFMKEDKTVFCIVNQLLVGRRFKNPCRDGLKAKILGVNKIFEVVADTLDHAFKGGNTEIKRTGLIAVRLTAAPGSIHADARRSTIVSQGDSDRHETTSLGAAMRKRIR